MANAAEKDAAMRKVLNRMRMEQVHKGALKANRVFTMKELVEVNTYSSLDIGLLGASIPTITVNGVWYAVVSYDVVTDTITVRQLGRSNEQDS